MKNKDEKTPFWTENKTELVVLLFSLIFCMIVGMIIGYSWGKEDFKNTDPPQVVLPTPTVAINLCSPPFNAIPNDSISDIDAFRLASDVIGNIKAECGETPMNITLNIPVGYYILDDSIDFKDAKVRIKTPPIIGLYGNDITLSGNSFMMLGKD